jgi:CheY-like chemotaxis protein
VLIAEDDPVSRRLLEATLAKWGYEVVTAADGTEAWRALGCADTPAAGRDLCGRALGGAVQPQHLPDLLRGRRQAAAR